MKAASSAPRAPVHLHIERLVLDGLALDRRQVRQLQDALQTELTRLLGQGGLASGVSQGGAVDALPAATVTWAGGNTAALGRQVAASVYRSLRI